MASKRGREGKRRQHLYRRPKDQPGAAFPGSHHCPDCGKWCYRSRDDAKAGAQQLHPGSAVRFYKCLPANRWWHFTSMNADKVRIIRARNTVTRDENGGGTGRPLPDSETETA